LAKIFVENFCHQNNLLLKKITSEAQRKLLSYAFPGNVRELKSVVELAVTLSDGDDIHAEHLFFGSEDIVPDILNKELTLREYEMGIINAFLRKYDNNIKIVAEKLDIGVSTIYRMLKEGSVL